MSDEISHKPEVKKWLLELEAAGKREANWRKEGRRIVNIYEAEKSGSDDVSQNHFNILFSNTETLLPALFNNTPRPVVERRHKDADPIGGVASKVCTRALAYLIDTNDQDYTPFTDLIESATLEALLPGRGITRFKYEAAINTADEVSAETVVGEEVPWDRIRMGYAKVWKAIPWLAFEHFMNREEAKKHFKDRDDIKFDIVPGKEDDKDSADTNTDGDSQYRLAHIFEIWDKESRKVIFVCPTCPEILKTVDAPLKLSGFFPCPRPLQLIKKVSSTTPTPLYSLYEEQAQELNTCTNRINKIMKAMKVRGFYDGTLSGLSELMNAPDNTLLPAENVAAMLQGQTLDRAIWFFPVEKLVGVLQQLYTQREQIKSVIYEITGVSDILRGSSRASETATAQNIKNQWGTLRLKRSQKEVMRYVRDCLRIMAEISGENLAPETFAAMTGMEFPTAAQKQQAQQLLPQLQQAMQPMPGPDGQPGQPDPQLQQQMAELQKILSKPSWEDILGVLGDDLQRQYKVDIETNSTVDAEATEDKQDVAEFLNSLSQFLNGVAPMIEQGYMSFDVAKTMLLAITRRFRFGTEVEDQIQQMEAPPPKEEGPDPKVQAEQQKMQMDAERNKQEAAHKERMMELEYQRAQMEMEIEREKMAFEREKLAQQHQMDLQDMQEKAMMSQQQRAMKLQEQADKAAMAAQQPQGEPNANV